MAGVEIVPYEKMILIDEAEYMRLAGLQYPRDDAPLAAVSTEGDDDDDDDDDDDGGSSSGSSVPGASRASHINSLCSAKTNTTTSTIAH